VAADTSAAFRVMTQITVKQNTNLLMRCSLM
jgi:hypothetical protein